MHRPNASISPKLMLPVISVLIFLLLGALISLPPALRRAAQDAAAISALETVNQFRVIRGYYTKNIVGPAMAGGALKPSIDHANNANQIPLPATMIQDISACLNKTNINSISPLVSPMASASPVTKRSSPTSAASYITQKAK